MLKPFDDTFVAYYQKELSYLREAGEEFSKSYPSLGQELGLKDTTCSDPHIERLLESFSFLTARIGQEINDHMPSIAHHLLEVLYPTFVQMKPACAIASFDCDESKNFSTKGVTLEARSQLWSYGEKDQTCRFQTVYPLTFWPLRLEKVDLISTQSFNFMPSHDYGKKALVLRVTFPFDPPSSLEMEHLTFHLSGAFFDALQLYEELFKNIDQTVYATDETGEVYKNFHLNPKGFSKNESLTPQVTTSHVGYELLLDYFHFPEKYLFFDLIGPWSSLKGRHIDFIIPLEKSDFLTPAVLENAFMINSTPIINLFERTADPISFDHKSLSYRLVPDQRRETTTEVFSVLDVHSIQDPKDQPKKWEPFYHFTYESLKSDRFWIAKREPSWLEHLPGSTIYLNFVDKKFNPLEAQRETIYVKTLCTNRFLTNNLSAGTKLYYDQTLPVLSISLKDKPCPQQYAPQKGETLWQLVGLLKSYHQPLLETDRALSSLKELLGLFCSTSSQGPQEIQTIIDLSSKRIVKRVGKEAWRGFIEGLHVDLVVNRYQEAGQKSFLLATVLRHFFAQTIGLGGFIELTLKSHDSTEESVTWPALTNDKILR